MEQNTHAQIIEILDSVPDMALATIRPDGFPQTTVVAFVHDDLTLYFATEAASQKAQNLAHDDKVSLTVTKPYGAWSEIEGISAAGHAHRLTDLDEIARVQSLLDIRFPEITDLPPEDPDAVLVFRIDLVVISLLDYAKGFGHAALIDVQERLAPAG